jgi:hypothetical protein
MEMIDIRPNIASKILIMRKPNLASRPHLLNSMHHGSYANIRGGNQPPDIKFPDITAGSDEKRAILIRKIATASLSSRKPRLNNVLEFVQGKISTRNKENIRGIDFEPIYFDDLKYKTIIRKVNESIPLPKQSTSNHIKSSQTIMTAKSKGIVINETQKDFQSESYHIQIPFVPKAKNTKPNIEDKVKLTRKQQSLIESELAQPVLKLENVWLK